MTPLGIQQLYIQNVIDLTAYWKTQKHDKSPDPPSLHLILEAVCAGSGDNTSASVGVCTGTCSAAQVYMV